MKNNVAMNEKYPKREYMNISVETVPKKSITIRKSVKCSECGEDSIVSINLDTKFLKGLIEGKNPMKKRDLDKLLKAVASVPPPKSWKETD